MQNVCLAADKYMPLLWFCPSSVSQQDANSIALVALNLNVVFGMSLKRRSENSEYKQGGVLFELESN